ncbi:MAG: ATP-binding cassette domain-containing protein [Microvirga sp.]
MLVLSNVDAGYGGFQALFDVSMTVEAGEAVAVIGANGAGKTTLLRVVSGLLPASRGDMTMEGVRLTAIAPHRIVETGIAHVPESRRLFPRLTVEGNLKMGAFIPAARARFAERLAYVYGLFPRLKERRNQLAGTMSGGEQQMCAIARALMSGPKLVLLDEPSMGLAPVVVAQVFELFPRLQERRDQKAGTMSGGEQQMCAIGRALMARPKLLLLDEPSLGLAPIFVERIFDIIRQINTEGTAILLVEQNALMALDAAHRGYVLETGRIVLADTAESLKTNEQVRKTYLGES